MKQIISEPITVLSSKAPLLVIWKGRRYKITKIGLHHKYKKGEILYHVFSVLCDTIFMRLELNTSNLSWKIMDYTGNF